MPEFRHPHHQNIAAVLKNIDKQFLGSHGIAFGGGTAIALKNDEYRVSVDIDFMVSDKDSFRKARESIKLNSLQSIFNTSVDYDLRQADKYAIRAFVFQAGVQIKLEVVFDAYLDLKLAPRDEWILEIPTLSTESLIAGKLLANSDRWQDSAVFSRDILDLTLMNKPPGSLKVGLALATAAYDSNVASSAVRAIDQLLDEPGRLARCIDALTIQKLSLAALTTRLSAFKLELEAASRE